MGNKQRVNRLLLYELFKQMVGHFEISQLRKDLQLEFFGGAVAPLHGR